MTRKKEYRSLLFVLLPLLLIFLAAGVKETVTVEAADVSLVRGVRRDEFRGASGKSHVLCLWRPWI